MVPLCEEFLFRGVILSQFRKIRRFLCRYCICLVIWFITPQFLANSVCIYLWFWHWELLWLEQIIWIPVGIHMFVNGFYVLLNIVRFHCSATTYAAVFYIIIFSNDIYVFVFCIISAAKEKTIIRISAGSVIRR